MPLSLLFVSRACHARPGSQGTWTINYENSRARNHALQLQTNQANLREIESTAYQKKKWRTLIHAIPHHQLQASEVLKQHEGNGLESGYLKLIASERNAPRFEINVGCKASSEHATAAAAAAEKSLSSRSSSSWMIYTRAFCTSNARLRSGYTTNKRTRIHTTHPAILPAS